MVEEEQKNPPDDCPSPEKLNAFADGQLDDAAIVAHLEHCASCKSILKSYGRIDGQIKENLRRPTQRDMGILVRIKDESMKEIERNGPSLFSGGLILRIIVSISIVGILLYMIHYFREYSRNPVPKVVRQGDGGGKNGDPTVQTMTKRDLELITVATTFTDQFANCVVTTVGTNTELLRPIIGDKPIEEPKTTKKISQEWSAADPGDGVRFLKYLLAQKYREGFDRLIVESGDQSVVNLFVTQSQLQILVNSLDKIGLKPSSEDGPKPGGKLEGTELVHYEVQFVRFDE